MLVYFRDEIRGPYIYKVACGKGDQVVNPVTEREEIGE